MGCQMVWDGLPYRFVMVWTGEVNALSGDGEKWVVKTIIMVYDVKGIGQVGMVVVKDRY